MKIDVNILIYDVSLSSSCTTPLIRLILINHSLRREFYNDYNKLILHGQVYYCIAHKKNCSCPRFLYCSRLSENVKKVLCYLME